MICLILLMMLSCQSTNYYEVAGIKNELFTKREGTHINDFINYRAINRAINNRLENKSEKREEIDGESREGGETLSVWEVGGKINKNEKEVKNMDGDFSNLITTITSAMAGIYVAIKTIIAFVKKLKEKK